METFLTHNEIMHTTSAPYHTSWNCSENENMVFDKLKLKYVPTDALFVMCDGCISSSDANKIS